MRPPNPLLSLSAIPAPGPEKSGPPRIAKAPAAPHVKEVVPSCHDATRGCKLGGHPRGADGEARTNEAENPPDESKEGDFSMRKPFPLFSRRGRRSGPAPSPRFANILVLED